MSNDMHRTGNAPADVAATAPPQTPAVPPAVPTGNGVPRTRTGATWFGICTAVLLLVVLIVFMVQNTRGVEISFLWMHGSLPLALALLIAAVGSMIVTIVVGAARITQLRRLTRRQRH